MAEADKMHERLYENYKNSIEGPQREKVLAQREKERQAEQQAALRMDAAAGYVQN